MKYTFLNPHHLVFHTQYDLTIEVLKIKKGWELSVNDLDGELYFTNNHTILNLCEETYNTPEEAMKAGLLINNELFKMFVL